MKKWSLKNLPDLSQQVVIVTGANSGIGYQSSKAFAQAGAKVIMACRNIEKGEIAKSKILKKHQNADLEVMQVDMSDLNSVKQFAKNFKEKYQSLNILLNNAGVMMVPYGLTKDGFEAHLGINYLSHFFLTAHLLEVLLQTPQARVVSVSSIAHRSAVIDTTDMMYQKNLTAYTPMKAYRRSKMANLLFAYELQRFFDKNNLNLLSVVAHPGISVTSLMRDYEKKWYLKPVKLLAYLFLQTASKGALSIIRAAVDKEVKGGEYYGPANKKQTRGYPVLVQSNEESYNESLAKDVWEYSEKAVGLSYTSILSSFKEKTNL